MARVPFRFVHAADVHLDTPFRSRSAGIRARMADASRRAFAALVDLCLDEDVHALLIAGDLFDDERLSFATEAFLVEQLGRLTSAGITVVVVTGNHDPGRPGFRAHRVAWPRERFSLIASRGPQTVRVSDRDGRVVGHVVGRGYEDAAEGGNLARGFPAPPGPGPAVAILHTQVSGTEGAAAHRSYAPCSRLDLRAQPYAYWALGHVHTRQRVLERPAAWYPGNLMGRHFGECGPRGALVVTADRDGTDVSFRELAPLRWEEVCVGGLDGVLHLSDLERAVIPAVAARQAESRASEWMLRIKLTGACGLAPELRAPEARDDLGEHLRDRLAALDIELDVTGLSRPLDLEAQRGRPDLLGQVLAVIDEIRRDDARLDSLAPRVLAAHPPEDSAARWAYLRELLDGAEREIVEWLAGEEGA